MQRREAGTESPIVKLVNMIFMDAINKKASTISFLDEGERFAVHFEIQGKDYEVMVPPLKLREQMLRRVVMMANPRSVQGPQQCHIALDLGEPRFRVSCRLEITLPATIGPIHLEPAAPPRARR